MFTATYQSPIGQLRLVGNHCGVKQILFPNKPQNESPPAEWASCESHFHSLITQLDDYFVGKISAFTVKLAPEGTPFQQHVWQSLQQIPYSETISYGDLAKQIGRPNASRAVGAANGANPIPIIIPCHRVIGAGGKLTGFGGGLATKQWLLSHERGVPDLFDFTNL